MSNEVKPGHPITTGPNERFFPITLCNAQLVLYEGRNRERYLELQHWQEIQAYIQSTACLRAEEDTFHEGKIRRYIWMRLVGKRLLSVVAA